MRFHRFLSLGTTFFLASAAVLRADLAPLTNTSAPLDAGWYYHRTFGYYHAPGQDSWLYHLQLGWLYAWPEEGGAIWWWAQDQGLSWTHLERTFPYIYFRRCEDWLEMKTGGPDRPAGDPLMYSPRENLTAPLRQLVPSAPPGDADYRPPGNSAKIELGRLLFFDKELSGNRNISCATCHHPTVGTGDGLSLPIGEGGSGLGPARDTGEAAGTPVVERVPRNAPAIWNLGALEFGILFHDGRLAADPSQPSGFFNPAADSLPHGLESPLAAQAMFPVQSGAEMAGQPGENEVADAAADGRLDGPGGVWDLLAGRLRAIPAYVSLFTGAYDHVGGAADITFVDAANAIAAFEEHAGRADQSPFDRYLRGERSALSGEAFAGMWLFYGEARCSSCHSGSFQTDQRFHSIALPQIGPGKGGGPDGHDDFGREHTTGSRSDRHRFRTPSLRNVSLTAPYGHNGAYASLREIVEHHLDPERSLQNYTLEKAVLPHRADLDQTDGRVMSDPGRIAAIAASSDLPEVHISDREVDQIMAFLRALEDPSSRNNSHLVPDSVPSGLPVVD